MKPSRKLALLTAATLLMLTQNLSAQSIRVIEDERYGFNPAHQVDIYLPAESESPNPVLTIMAGPTKSDRDAWRELARNFAQSGYAVVVAGYRQLNDLQWPQGPDEMRDIAGWVRASLDMLGAAREGMMMDGQQGMMVIAEGTAARHVASNIYYEPSHMGRGGTGFGAAVLINPEQNGMLDPVVAAYFKDDAELMAQSQPSVLARNYAEAMQVPLLILDTDSQTAGLALKESACSFQSLCPERVQTPHVSPEQLLLQIQSAEPSLFALMQEFFMEHDSHE